MISKEHFNWLNSIFLLMLLGALAGCSNKFYRAIEKGNEDQVRQLLEAGTDINKASKCMNCYMDGETPLEHAARYGNPHIIKFLIDKGARPGGDDLTFAARTGYPDVINLFLDNGALVNNDKQISYALLNAFRYKRRDAVDLLLEKGAKVPADAASVILRENISVYSVDGSKDIWNTNYNDQGSKYFSKGSFLFLPPGSHKIMVLLADSGSNYLSCDINVEGGSVYLLEAEVIRKKVNDRTLASWRPVFTKIR